MSEAVVFNGHKTLEFHEIRQNVIRIPEVISKVYEAQDIWDKSEQSDINLINFISSKDEDFLKHIKLKSLVTSVVQIGLFERYVKKFGSPNFFIGNTQGDSALKVCTHQISFSELILESPCFQLQKPTAPLYIVEDPLLAGVSLSEYQVYEFKDQEFTNIKDNVMNIQNIVQLLIDEHNLKKFVNIGPGNILVNRSQLQHSLSDVQILESIDLDPMLNWFWSGVKRPDNKYLAIAQ